MNEKFSGIVNKFSILVLCCFLVATADCAKNETKAYEYMADIVVTNFDNCWNDRPNYNEFYTGIVANQNTRAKISGHDMTSECWTQCRIAYINNCNTGNGLTVGLGFDKKYSNAKLYENLNYCLKNHGRWVWMGLPRDVRNLHISEYVVSVTAQNGIGQIYIPLLHAQDSGLTNGRSYMIRITNDYNLWNDGKPFAWQLGDVENWNSGWAGGKAVYRRIEMNISCVLEHIDDKFSANVRSCMSPYVETRPTVNWNDVNVKSLMYKTNGYTTGELCGSISSPPGKWVDVIRKIKEVYSELNGLWPGFV